ncbi:MAG: phage integrase N-terminal SAM-like domain-containing protein [Sulfurimicrobium sp.]|nr:phage integrase N-terminal SAM-like domain-containing protein [Sulfurimicrobium sp.]
MSDSTGLSASPRLLDQVRGKIRLKHYSIRTEQAYLDWIKRFILHFDKRHPAEMGAREVEIFLTWLAVDRRDDLRCAGSVLSRNTSQVIDVI